MNNTIIEATLRHLVATPGFTSQAFELRLTRFFTVARLSDGSVGACMSYYKLPDTVLAEAERGINDWLNASDPRAWDIGVIDRETAGMIPHTHERGFVVNAVLTAIASAYSVRILQNGGDHSFSVSARRPPGLSRGVQSAVVVGCGGYLYTLAKEPPISHVHVVDFDYRWRAPQIDAELAELARQYPGKRFTAATRLRPDEFCTFDLMVITGSTLSNGTLDGLLALARGGPRVVVQGQSVAVHPKVLFDSGVELVVTSLKPTVVSDIPTGDFNGDGLKSRLDGSDRSPWIYLSPRKDVVGTPARVA
jgi:hypothetical protein